MFNSAKLWNEFKDSFVKNCIENSNMHKMMHDKGKRTRFYKNTLFVNISRDLNLWYDKTEWLRVDAVFYKIASKGDWQIPVVFIESENDYNDNIVQTELPKLYSLNAPLKVMFLWTEWHANKMEEISEKNFNFFIDEFSKEITPSGYFAIIVGDVSDNYIRFHSFVYDENGKIIDKETKLVDIHMQ